MAAMEVVVLTVQQLLPTPLGTGPRHRLFSALLAAMEGTVEGRRVVDQAKGLKNVIYNIYKEACQSSRLEETIGYLTTQCLVYCQKKVLQLYAPFDETAVAPKLTTLGDKFYCTS